MDDTKHNNGNAAKKSSPTPSSPRQRRRQRQQQRSRGGYRNDGGGTDANVAILAYFHHHQQHQRDNDDDDNDNGDDDEYTVTSLSSSSSSFSLSSSSSFFVDPTAPTSDPEKKKNKNKMHEPAAVATKDEDLETGDGTTSVHKNHRHKHPKQKQQQQQQQKKTRPFRLVCLVVSLLMLAVAIGGIAVGIYYLVDLLVVPADTNNTQSDNLSPSSSSSSLNTNKLSGTDDGDSNGSSNINIVIVVGNDNENVDQSSPTNDTNNTNTNDTNDTTPGTMTPPNDGGQEESIPTMRPSPQPTSFPTITLSSPAPPPTAATPIVPAPVPATPTTTTTTTDNDDQSVVLFANQFLERDELVSSPSGQYQVGLSVDGDLVLLKKTTTTQHQQQTTNVGEEGTSPQIEFNSVVIEGEGGTPGSGSSTSSVIVWSSSSEVTGRGTGTGTGTGYRCFLQGDGNLIVRDDNQQPLWSTETHGYPGAELVVTDQGQIALQVVTTSSGGGAIAATWKGGPLPLQESSSSTTTTTREETNRIITTIWMQGIPRGTYEDRTALSSSIPAATASTSNDTSNTNNHNLVFPVRGAFYYPWYPQTWWIGGHRAHYVSTMGLYSSSDKNVASFHIDSLDYAKFDLSIASWWGPSTHLDRARITMLMDETTTKQSSLKWTVYHEVERDHNQNVTEITNDLNYLKRWFAWHDAWAHIDDKPVIFVYNEGGCDVARRWSDASNGEWYVVLKIFPGHQNCEYRPDSFHQYGVGLEDGTVHNRGHSFVLSPGFWRADTDIPMVPRVDVPTFCNNTKRMVESNEPWQLVVSFNEAGEGTMIESSPSWESSNGSPYGSYLDCLHENF